LLLEGGGLPGRVTRIAAKSAAGTGVFDVEVTVPNPPADLSSGRIVNLRIAPRAGGAAPPLAVPASALIEGFGDVATLYIVNADGKTVTRRQVKLAGIQGGDLLVADGLAPGDRVVASGGAYLRTDSTVSIAGTGN
jgi:multidrug efflux pump subunit AcrA (membrane-fusion protein)